MQTTTLEKPSFVSLWWRAARPKTLAAGVVPVIVGAGAALGTGEVRWPAVALALLCSLLIQVGTNLANDVFDYEKGADTSARLGPARATQAGWVTPRQMRAAMMLVFAAAVAAGGVLVVLGGWPILLIGILAVASGIAYTGGPYPLGYNGLGDLFVFVFFGPVAVAGTAYLAYGAWSPVAVAAGLPVGALSAAILVVNNLRDRHTDAAAGKKTLAVRFGDRFARREYAALLILAYVGVVPLAAVGATPFVMLSFGSLPLAVKTGRRLAAVDGAALNPLLGETARLLLVFGLLLAVGLAVA